MSTPTDLLISQVRSYNNSVVKGRDPDRIPIFCEALAGVWSLVPDWRFGQLVINLLGRDPGLFYLEDEDSLKKLKAAFEQLNK